MTAMHAAVKKVAEEKNAISIEWNDVRNLVYSRKL